MNTNQNTVVLGNPGAGKSTLLNGLVKSARFRSGISIGGGLTHCTQSHVNEANGITYTDTPGLADTAMREQAARQIVSALNRTGRIRLLFVVKLNCGRLSPEDLDTIRFVLETFAPEVGVRYGIIVNQVTRSILESPERQAVVKTTFRRMRLNTTYMFFHGFNHDLHDEDDCVPELSCEFTDFIERVPLNAIRFGQVSPTPSLKDPVAAVTSAFFVKLSRAQDQQRALEERYKAELAAATPDPCVIL